MRRMLFPTTALIALAVLAACSSDNTSVAPSSSSGPTTSVADVSTTVGTDTTLAPPPTEPTTVPTTAAATTVAPSVGWTVVDPSTIEAPLAFPCCASNWYPGTPSPVLPAAGQPLADGVYRVSIEWPADPTQPFTATVSRFDQCSVLPVGSCEDPGGSYAPEDYGVDPSSSVAITLTLDSNVTVVLGGFAGGDGAGNFASATGADLAALIAAVDADYQVAVLDRRDAGMTFDEVVADLQANPANGFGAPAEEFAGSLAYTFDDAPPLLFQGLPGFGPNPEGARGSDVVGSISLEVMDGRYILYTYAGFYS